MLGLIGAVVLYKAVNFTRYALAAKRTGLPHVYTIFLETEVWGYLMTPILRAIYHDYLLMEKGWPEWCRFMIKDWAWEDKRRAHDQYGDVFLVVSPEGIICYSSDAALNYEVFNRRNEFLKPRDKYSESNSIVASGSMEFFHASIVEEDKLVDDLYYMLNSLTHSEFLWSPFVNSRNRVIS